VTAKLRDAASEGGIFGSALVAEGAVYFADGGGGMYCLDAETGKERWKVDSRASTFPDAHWLNILMASPIIADAKVVFGGGALEGQRRNLAHRHAVARSLAAAHQHSLIHCDVEPANILRENRVRRVKRTNFDLTDRQSCLSTR
jgi:hypothetical protein